MKTNEKFVCPCCGWDQLAKPPYVDLVSSVSNMDKVKPPYDRVFGTPSFEVCGCCGFMFGVTDSDSPILKTLRSFREHREQWMFSLQAEWHDPKQMPKNWSLIEQLTHAGIPLCSTLNHLHEIANIEKLKLPIS